MVFWTCHIFKVNPQFDNFVKDVMTHKGEYIYDNIDNKNLYFYIDGFQITSYGKIIDVNVDKPIRIFNREEGTILAKETISLDVCLYENPPELSNFLAVFSSAESIRWFAYAIRLIISEKVRESRQFPNMIMVRPLLPVRFKLKGKEKELSKYFSNVRELSVRNIKDMYVHRANIGGVFLEQSGEYQKYVRSMDVSGDVNYFGVTFRDRVIMLSSEGKIWTRQGKDEVELNVVEGILKILLNCDALFIIQ
jgi:hypothetical protein